ncbi:hypothetical protein A6V36_06925 [Paraburkholderia ginsengiterrae]|uniref:Uncharacterized protein n=1 Tax=Paraburkholderia ginsengiterrae TaxID=1462993 RepID=A0A1A9N1T5_9BURK|nr:hypothetical protein A6V37_07300 [Paraburkholderia ginsengiterrae]OAJ56249.1 hypothetical protein A6V36_06925 [Paraburkholderia ginsengiterrae]
MSLEIVPQVARKQNGKFRQPPLKKTQVAAATDLLLKCLALDHLAVVPAVAQRGDGPEMAEQHIPVVKKKPQIYLRLQHATT